MAHFRQLSNMSQVDGQSALKVTLEKAFSLSKQQRFEDCRTTLEGALAAPPQITVDVSDQSMLVTVREKLVGCYLMLLATGRQNSRMQEDLQKLISEQIAILDSQCGSSVRLQELQGWKEVLCERYESALRYFEQIPR